jgi:hypothetical protein
MPDAKVSPIVKYVVAATGLRQREAWELLQQVSEDHYTRILLAARRWDRTVPQGAERPVEQEATNQLTEIVGTQRLARLMAARPAADALTGRG